MKVIADYACQTGECPLWRTDSQTLYWCDVATGGIFSWEAVSGESRQLACAGTNIGGMTFEDDGALLCFMHQGRVARWHNGEWTSILAENPGLIPTRFNDVIAQPDGTVLCGTMPDDHGRACLYHLSHQRELTLVMDGLKLSNGLGYSPDLQWLYLADTRAYTVYRLSYNCLTGFPSNPQPWIDFRQRPGRPDGLTVDRSGNLWVAEIGASQLTCFDPAGKELCTVPVPIPQVTSLTFGGLNWRQVFVTSLIKGERSKGCPQGATFCGKISAVGLPEFVSTIGGGKRVL